MTDLTEQWKKRTLRNGAYYIKTLGGDILPAFCNTEYILKQFQTMKGIYDDVAEVLAPVPSYEELQNMNKAVNECMAANIKLVEENAQLKEQINKSCLDAINRGTANTVKAVKEFGMPERIEELVEQNAQFKELLKKCRPFIQIGFIQSAEEEATRLTLLTKIDEVLK